MLRYLIFFFGLIIAALVDAVTREPYSSSHSPAFYVLIFLSFLAFQFLRRKPDENTSESTEREFVAPNYYPTADGRAKETSVEVPASPAPERGEPRAHLWRTPTIAALVAFLVVGGSFAYYLATGVPAQRADRSQTVPSVTLPFSTPPRTAPTSIDRWHSTVNIGGKDVVFWDSDRCKHNLFPQLENPASYSEMLAMFGNDPTAKTGILRSIVVMNLFCGRSWDWKKIDKLNDLINASGLVPSKWGGASEQLANAEEAIFKTIDQNLFKLVNLTTAAPILRFAEIGGPEFDKSIASKSSLNQAPNFPSADQIRAALRDIDLDQVITESIHPPRLEILKDTPRIRLFVDTDLPMRLRDLATSQLLNFSDFGGNSELASNLGVAASPASPDTPTTDLNPVVNPEGEFFTSYLKRHTSILLAISAKSNAEHIGDLDIIWYHDAPKPDCGKAISHSTSFYCPDPRPKTPVRSHAIIYVEQPETRPFFKRERSASALFETTTAMFHEVAHHFQWRWELAGSPFLLEGGATEAGESAIRTVTAAYPLAIADQKAALKLANSFFLAVQQGDREQLDKLNAYARETIEKSPLTSKQQAFVCLLKNHQLDGGAIEDQLKRGANSFFDLSNVKFGYALGWLVYDTAHPGQSQPAEWLNKLQRWGQAFSQGDVPELQEIREGLTMIAAQADSNIQTLAKRVDCSKGLN